jgi:hypothetical protein
MADEGLGARANRAIERQRQEIARTRLVAGVLAVALVLAVIAAIILPRTRAAPAVAGPGPAPTVTETVTELRTEARLVLQDTVPVVVPRRLPEQNLRADVFELRVQSICPFRALNYQIFADVTNTSAGLAGGVRARLIYYNVDDTWIGAADADLPVMEPNQTVTVPFSATIPCSGQMGSQTVMRVEATLL